MPKSISSRSPQERGHSLERISLLGTVIDNLTLREAADRICSLIDSHGPYGYVVPTNVDCIVKLRHDPLVREAWEHAALVVPDGVPLLWATRILGTPLKARVNGTDLFELLAALSAERGYSLFFLGGNPGSAERAAEVLKSRHPTLNIVGTYCPPLGFDSDEAMNRRIQDQIRASEADLLFMGIGAPRQELWMYRYGGGCGVSAAVAIGGSFSLVAGEIRRAPAWMQRRGLEWLWRLMVEPRRLWKRYLVDDMPFLALVVRERLRK